MDRTVRFLLVALALAVGLGACGPKPTPGQTDREHAQDALDKLK